MQQRYDVSITTVIYWVTAPITHKLKKSIVEKVCGDLYALNKWANFLFISWSEKIMLLIPILFLGKVVSIISWKNIFLSKDEDINETIKHF